MQLGTANPNIILQLATASCWISPRLPVPSTVSSASIFCSRNTGFAGTSGYGQFKGGHILMWLCKAHTVLPLLGCTMTQCTLVLTLPKPQDQLLCALAPAGPAPAGGEGGAPPHHHRGPRGGAALDTGRRLRPALQVLGTLHRAHARRCGPNVSRLGLAPLWRVPSLLMACHP